MIDARQPIENAIPPAASDADMERQTRIAIAWSCVVSAALAIAIMWPSLRVDDAGAAFEDFRHSAAVSIGGINRGAHSHPAGARRDVKQGRAR